MPRKLRLEYEGAVCHVMNRGDPREEIFLGEDDRLLFLETLKESCLRTGRDDGLIAMGKRTVANGSLHSGNTSDQPHEAPTGPEARKTSAAIVAVEMKQNDDE